MKLEPNPLITPESHHLLMSNEVVVFAVLFVLLRRASRVRDWICEPLWVHRNQRVLDVSSSNAVGAFFGERKCDLRKYEFIRTFFDKLMDHAFTRTRV